MGAKFRRQHPFGRWILDCYGAEARLAIELDGGQHAEPEHEAADRRRDAWLSRCGAQVLRFWNDDVLTDLDTVLRVIWEALQEVTCGPHAGPVPEGEGTDSAGTAHA